MADVSIITPILDQASTIQNCIDSVAMQNVKVEHIIIDGGSSDGTVDIIKNNQDKLSYWVSESDSGQSQAINKGLARATGTYFNWLNADDQLTPNALETVLELAKSQTQVVIGKCEHIDTSGAVLDSGSAKVWSSTEATLGNYSMGQPSVYYRTEIVHKLGGLNEQLHLCLDMDLWFRFLCKYGIEKVVSTDTVLSKFLVHENAKSTTQKEEMIAEKYGIYKALFSGFKLEKPISDFLSNYTPPKNLSYHIPHLNSTEILSNFACHLLTDAYSNREIRKAKELLKVVVKGTRFSNKEKLAWKTRLISAQVLKR